jgi:hypothetical protein
MLAQAKEPTETLPKGRDACGESAEIPNHINSIEQKPPTSISQNRWKKITKRLRLALGAMRKLSSLKP